jgi:hypothetical protein
MGPLRGRGLLELMRTVCSAGRATWTIDDTGKYSIVYDGDTEDIANVFSPRNSWGYKGVKVFTDLPHALRVSFRDRDNDYLVGERVVYRDGYTSANATKFETTEFDGQVDAEMVYKKGRWEFAQAVLRPETHELYADPEYLVASRGSRVRVAYDIPMWGSDQFRIKTIDIDGSNVEITVDGQASFETGNSYAVLIRVNSGNPINVAVDNPGTIKTETITFELAPASSSKLAVGNLILFGLADSHFQDLIVKFIYPINDYAARLVLVDYNSDIYDDETVYGEIPEYDPNITAPIEIRLPPSPVIDTVISDETAIITQKDGTLISRMIVVFSMIYGTENNPAVKVECHYRKKEVGILWIKLPELPVSTGEYPISPVVDGETYEIRLRLITSYGKTSDWVYNEHTVIGKTSPPPVVSNFLASIVDNQVVLQWDLPTVADFRRCIVRYGSSSATWETSTLLTKTVKDSHSFIAKWSGTRYFFIKAEDTSYNVSEEAAVEIVTIIVADISGLTAEVIDNNVLFRWTNVPGTLPISKVEIRKGTSFDTAEVIGSKSGTFTTVFENTGGQFKYWLVPIDTAENYGNPKSITATVNSPASFVLNRRWTQGFDGGNSTNVLVLDDGTAIAPAYTEETVQEHFVNNGANIVQDLIDDEFLYAIEPVPLSAEYSEEFDHEALLSVSSVELDLDETPYNGGALITEYLAEKEESGDAWNETSGIPSFFYNFRYVRDRFTFVSDGHKFNVLNSHTVRMNSRTISESGTGTVSVASTGVVVNFGKEFADVSSISVTPLGNTPKYEVVDFSDIPNPTSFTVYLFDENGDKTTGSFTYRVEGF